MASPRMATCSEMTSKKAMLVLLVMVGFQSAGAQVSGLTPADTVHTDFGGLPQLVFSPQPPLAAALDPRRQLSLQQQTHILTDIQQHHHRFFQQPQALPPPAQQQQLQQLAPQPQLLYSQQTEVGASAPSAPRETEPIYQPQPGQFVRLHAQAAAPPSASDAASPPAQVQHHQFSAHQPLVRTQSVAFGGPGPLAPQPPSAAAAVLQNTLQGSTSNATSGALSPHEQLRSLRRRPGDSGAAVAAPSGIPTALPRPRGRSEDGGVHQQIFLQDERQKLFEQIKDYNQQQQQQQQKSQQQKSQQQPGPSFQLEQQGLGGDRGVETPLPPPSDVNDNPLKPQDTRTKVNPLRQQQQQQLLQAQLQKQFQLQLLQRQELIRQLKQALANTPAPTHRDQILPHPSGSAARLGNSTGPLYLANGQQLQIFDTPQERAAVARNSVTTRSTVAAPTTERPTTPSTRPVAVPTAPTAPVKAPKALFDELTKGVLPPGAAFEVIRHKQDGGLEEVNKLPPNLPDKKVTFVFLEEQPDGSVKIQGVRGNAEPAANKTSPEGLDSIIKNIQEGNIKLPPSTRLQGAPTGIPAVETTPQASVLNPTFLTKASIERTAPSPRPNVLLPTLNPKTEELLPRLSDNTVSLPAPSDTEFFPSVAFSSPDGLTSTLNPYIEINNFQQHVTTTTSPPPPPPPPPPSPSAPKPSSRPTSSESLFISSPSSQPAYNSRNVIQSNSAGLPQFAKPSQETVRISAAPANRPTSPPRLPAPAITPAPSRSHFSPTPVTTVAPPAVIVNSPSTSLPPTTLRPTARPTPRTSPAAPTTPPPPPPPPPPPAPVISRVSFPGSEAASTNGSATLAAPAPAGVLTQVLKKEGLFAMAKFLKDSGLDSILNDTGPYTIFIPTDKAFRALLVQLGGPDKAEIKFRENPRLLSGLLLHHVIPGAFHLGDLQDEMTGVSLAGTQLRVNTYRTQDTHWNDVQVTTINGARVVRGLHDIPVPQGVAHALDRVMFPLPVGDLLQTLAADRERRFTRLLRLVRVAGMEALLSGARTHTLLAPTDKALAAAPGGELQRALKDAGRARALLQRHLVAGALYGAGLRFYQERPTLAANRPVALAKADGQLKANSAHVLTPNIPATNGVLHVIDSVL